MKRMSSSLHVVEKGKGSAVDHMARDRAMLAAGSESPLLLFYEWDSFCVTYGLFAAPETVLKMDFCRKNKISIAPRPTGGGILFHERDFPFSLFVPESFAFSMETLWPKIQKNLLKSMETVLETLPHKLPDGPRSHREGRFCMAEAHECDFVWKGKKFGGAAFRKSKKGLLCQATLFAGEMLWEKCAACLKDPTSLDVMRSTSSFLSSIPAARERVIKAIQESL